MVLENIDWERGADGSLSSQWTLPNFVTFGAQIRPREDSVDMELWLRNFSGADLTGQNASAGLRNQVCVMLKGAPEFNAQTNENKILRTPVAAVHSDRRQSLDFNGLAESCPFLGEPAVFPVCTRILDCPTALTGKPFASGAASGFMREPTLSGKLKPTL